MGAAASAASRVRSRTGGGAAALTLTLTLTLVLPLPLPLTLTLTLTLTRYPGPLAKEFKTGEKQPRYKHAASRFSLRVRGIETSKSDVMMSGICKSQSNHFVGTPSPLLLTPSPSP